MEEKMKNKKKVEFLTQRVTELEKENFALRNENHALSAQLDANKRVILLKQKSLDKKEKQIDDTRKNYENCVIKLKKAEKDYKEATRLVAKTKKKYDDQFSDLLKRLNKQN